MAEQLDSSTKGANFDSRCLRQANLDFRVHRPRLSGNQRQSGTKRADIQCLLKVRNRWQRRPSSQIHR